jgi:hypothetical protein
MGAAFWPYFDRKVRSTAYCDEGKVLLREIDALDAVAAESNIKLLSSYADNRPIPDGFDGDPDDLEELLGPFEDWFEIKDGIETCEKLGEEVQTRQHINWAHWDSECVMDCLASLRQALEAGLEANAKFRLVIYS